MAKKPEDIELEEQHIFCRIPKNTLKMRIECTVIIGGKEQKVHKELMLDEINKAREDFLENVEGGDDYNTYYELTDKGKELIERLKQLGLYEELEKHD